MGLSALCGNPDCGAFIEPPTRGVPYLDRETELIVLLCPPCAEYVEDKKVQRFQPVEPKGASE